MNQLIKDLIRINESEMKFERGKVYSYSGDRINHLQLDDISKEILTKHGLAREMSPFVSFLPEEKGGFELFGDFIRRHALEGEELPDLEVFKNSYLFGQFNNWFLALSKKGEVLYIDNETFNTIYANKDFNTFLTILIRLNIMLEDYNEENPDGDFWEDVIDEDWVQEFEDYIEELDYEAVRNDVFWDEVIEMIQDN